MTDASVPTIVIGCAVAYLLLAYAFGGPVLLVRALVTAIGERRLRYRGRPEDVLANSRFTIPVSIILPTRGENVADAVEHLLTLHYPEFEVIVVNDGTTASLDELRERFALNACEVFFRRSIATGRVGGIFRSGTHERLLVVDCATTGRADALNCGVNLSRYRYVCCADARARYSPSSLLEAMHAAVEDPATIVGISTSLGPFEAHRVVPEGEPETFVRALHRLSALRGLLSRNLRRRLRLTPDNLPGFALWRRDLVVETGGFSVEVQSEQLEMTFRLHRHLLGSGQAYQMVHLSAPVGTPVGTASLAMFVTHRLERQHSLARVLWKYRGMILNPRYRSIGMVDLPRYLFGLLIVPWLELCCLVALPFAALAGVLTMPQLALVYAAIGLGNGVLLNAAMLLAPWPGDQRTLVRLLVLGPLEVFVARPVQLYSRLAAVLRVIVSRPAPAGA